MSNEVDIVDALPYIDTGYDDPGVRESALLMVEEECRRYRPTKNYLEHLPPLNSAFETKMMAQEFERIQNRQPMETLSMKRYELPPPAAGRLSELNAWQDSVRNSMAQLEHQFLRAMNLELMVEYGIESWKAYLEVLTALQAKAQVQLQQLKKEIQDVNWQRKQAQTNAGEKLRTLEANWVLLVSKNYEIEQQCVEMEKRLQSVQVEISQREQEQAEAMAIEEEEQNQIAEDEHTNGTNNSNDGDDDDEGNSNSNGDDNGDGDDDNNHNNDEDTTPENVNEENDGYDNGNNDDTSKDSEDDNDNNAEEPVACEE